jgi:hypothetical protein
MTRSTPVRHAVSASIAVAVFGASAAPAGAVVSLTPVRPCLSQQDAVSPNAAGLTPGGPVKFDLASNGRPLLSTTSQPAAADGTFRIAEPYPDSVTEPWFAGATADTIPLTMTVTDIARLNAGQPPASPEVAATTTLTFSRWTVHIATPGGRAPVPRARIRFGAVGWTSGIGRPLFVHYIRGRRDLHAERLGVLNGPCGAVTKTLGRAFPFRPVPAGQYRLLFNSSPNPNRGPAIATRLLRVRRRDAVPPR